MRKTIIFIIFIFSSVLFINCYKPDPVAPEPVIELISFTKIINSQLSNDTITIFDRGILMLSFTDGDGDIGLDTNAIDMNEHNFFIKYFEIQDGDTIETLLLHYDVIDQEYDTLTFNAVIPNLTPEYGAPTAIEGEISDTLFLYDPSSDFDTIMFKAYIVDRAGNESNTIATPLIVRKVRL